MLRSDFDRTFDQFLRRYGYQPDHQKNRDHSCAWFDALHKRYTIAQIHEVMAKVIEQDFAHADGKTRIYLPQLGRVMAMLKQLGNPNNPCTEGVYHCELCSSHGTVALYRTEIGKFVTCETRWDNKGIAAGQPVHFACSCPAGARWAAGIDDGKGTTIPPLASFSIDVLDQRYERGTP